MRRATWYLPGYTQPRRSGVGPRVNIVGWIVYWREWDEDKQEYVLRHEIVNEMLKMWDGTKKKITGKRKEHPTLEPQDYVRSSP